jgi:hypothetical protein
MAAYAATARIHDVRPRRSEPLHLADLTPWTAGQPVIEADTIDLAGRSFDDRVRDWWANASATWSQTVFFLFDPESWR